MKDRTGEKFITNEGYEIEIIEYKGRCKCTIKFKDKGTVLTDKCYTAIKKGEIKNPYHPSAYNIGYIGEGISMSCNGRCTKTYTYWKSMFRRCYDEKFKEKRPSYKDVTVCEEWHNFQNFAAWFEENYNPEIMQGWHIDKDLICKRCRVYSPETCCFVPQEINSILTKSENKSLPLGVMKIHNKFRASISCFGKNKNLGHYAVPEEAFQAYKTAKEKYIKEIADKYKHKITEKVYQALYNYQVEITD